MARSSCDRDRWISAIGHYTNNSSSICHKILDKTEDNEINDNEVSFKMFNDEVAVSASNDNEV